MASKESKFKVSVVIVSREKKALLEKTLEALSNQTLGKNFFEVIVVDDGSKIDDLKSLENKFKEKLNLMVLRQKSLGPAKGRNLGVKKAKAEIIAFTDNDCLPQTDWLEKVLAYFTDSKVIGVEGKIITDKRILFSSAPENLFGAKFPTANIAYRKKIIEKSGYFNEKMGFWREDSEFAFRVMKLGQIVFAENAIVYHPLRKDPIKNIFRHLFYLHNEWYCFFKHPKEYLKFLSRDFIKDLSKSILVILVFSFTMLILKEFLTNFETGFLLYLLFLLTLVVLFLFYFVNKKVGFDFSKSTFLEKSIFFFLFFLKSLAYPIFLLLGFLKAVILIILEKLEVRK